LVSKSSLFDGPIAYIRVSRVAEGLDQALRQSWQALAATNKLSGMVMDLRYANGTDYAAAAAATADLFVKKEQPLFDWGQGMVRTKEKTESISTPLAVLVNQQTAAAAEALAAALRETGAGLILGSRTAGAAMIAQEYPLNDGERLRIATTPIQLGDGTNLSSQGIKPDIAVEVSVADERAYYADSFKELSRPATPIGAGPGATNVAAGTNRTRRPRFNEAELVRERKNGVVTDTDISGADGSDADKPVIHDPVLARALDFLKGLSVMRQTRY
jgi:C-terminal processing protease CtpA/Prc